MKKTVFKLLLLSAFWLIFLVGLPDFVQSSLGWWFLTAWAALTGLATAGALLKAREAMRVRRLLAVRRKLRRRNLKTEPQKLKRLLNG